MILAILMTYGVAFFGLGIIFAIVYQRPMKPSGPKNRVKYDARIRRHNANGEKYHNVGERMWTSENSG